MSRAKLGSAAWAREKAKREGKVVTKTGARSPSTGGRTKSESSLAKSIAAGGAAVSPTNLPTSSGGSSGSPNKGRKAKSKTSKARKSAGSPYTTPTEFQSAITSLKKKYAPDGRTKGEAQLRKGMAEVKREAALDSAAIATVPNASPARKQRIRQSTSLSGDQKSIKEFRGAKVAGKQPPAAVIAAARAGKLKRGKKGNYTTPEVRQVRKKAARVSRKLTKAKLAASGGKRKALIQAGLDAEQAAILAQVLKVGNRMGATEKEKLSAVQTALVESNISNPTVATDHDSLGWRQERQMYYDNPTNVRASARRYFQETAAAGRGAGVSPGTLAQSVQRSAYPERYDERTAEAQPLLDAFNAGSGGGPKAKRRVEQLTKVAEDIQAEADKLGIEGVKGLDKEGKRDVAEVFIAKKRNGAYAGSQTMVGKMLGQKVWGDKEPGHSAGGDHDPTVGDAYAQDIQLWQDNPAEGEPTYDQALLDKMTRRIRKLSGDDSFPQLQMGMGMVETNIQGYRIQIIPDSESNFHGSGPHLHIGAKWTGESPPPGTSYGGSGGSPGGFQTVSVSPSGGASTSSASPASLAGRGPAGGKNRKADVLEKLGELGFQVTASGVKRTGLAARPAATAGSTGTVLKELKKKYGA
jgi:hypothetical protein